MPLLYQRLAHSPTDNTICSLLSRGFCLNNLFVCFHLLAMTLAKAQFLFPTVIVYHPQPTSCTVFARRTTTAFFILYSYTILEITKHNYLRQSSTMQRTGVRPAAAIAVRVLLLSPKTGLSGPARLVLDPFSIG